MRNILRVIFSVHQIWKKHSLKTLGQYNYSEQVKKLSFQTNCVHQGILLMHWRPKYESPLL